MIVGLTGLAGSGKGVVADVLVNEFGFTRVKFADPMKNMLRRMLSDMGHIAEDVERMLEGDLKEVPIPELGVSPRHLMITLGTEWGRDQVHAEIWTRLWAARAEQFDRVVADDVRFPNEVYLIRGLGGQLWRIHRPGVVAAAHSSEQLQADADRTLYNDGSIDELRATSRALAGLAGLAGMSTISDQIRERLAEIERTRAAMPPAERAELEGRERQAQRESWVRGMTTPCEHGVLDFEQCGECRACA